MCSKSTKIGFVEQYISSILTKVDKSGIVSMLFITTLRTAQQFAEQFLVRSASRIVGPTLASDISVAYTSSRAKSSPNKHKRKLSSEAGSTLGDAHYVKP